MSETKPDAQTFAQIELQPMPGALGVEIQLPPSFSVAAPDSGVVAEINSAWLEHQLVVFRGLSLSPPEQAQFCSLLGELDEYPFLEATTEHPNVVPIIKEPTQKLNFGGAWHTDTSYMENPPKATCLYALEVPRRGGDTLFANTAKAYAALSDGLKTMLAELTGVFTPSMVHGKQGSYSAKQASLDTKSAPEIAEQRVLHPVIRTHPETGRKSIYATPVHCERFENMSRAESLPLLNYLYEHATKPEFTTRLHWQPGTLAIWDNRCVFHNAINDYAGERREVHRVTLRGELPV